MRIRSKGADRNDQPGPVTVIRPRADGLPHHFMSPALKKRRAKRKSGVPGYSSIFIGWGYLESMFGEKRWWLRTANGNFEIVWFEKELPPTVKHGQYLCVIGNLKTYDLGSRIEIVGAMVVRPDKRRGWKNALTALFQRYSYAPHDFLGPD